MLPLWWALKAPAVFSCKTGGCDCKNGVLKYAVKMGSKNDMKTVTKCPIYFATDAQMMLIKGIILFLRYGKLPRAGGMFDQPVSFVRALEYWPDA